MLEPIYIPQIEDVPNTMFQQDDAPPPWSLNDRPQRLDEHFHNAESDAEVSVYHGRHASSSSRHYSHGALLDTLTLGSRGHPCTRRLPLYGTYSLNYTGMFGLLP